MRWLLFLALLAGCTSEADRLADRGLAAARGGDLSGAIRTFDEALAREPGHPKASYNRGVALLGLGDWAGAAAQFGRFVQSRPDDPLGWLEKARAEVLLEKREAGLASLQRAVELGFADHQRLVEDGVFAPLFSDLRWVALEMTVAQRAGVEPRGGVLGVQAGAPAGPGNWKLPPMGLGPASEACGGAPD